ncbi:hypothetical protein LUZ62_073026 [Rhynchospora pubera]|uniref:PHD-type domain-containing protein n=1 Tax=Rhynchospora pubera TaxID=906938 RepID=A0AAV8D5D1_9POAL|nr:hypothetical protein LUZ62_073026 [Rhynchospora pubera]
MRTARPRPPVHGMRSFPTEFAGAFRDNIRKLLEEHCEKCDVAANGRSTWRTTVRDECTGALVPVYAVEECVNLSSSPFCDYCRCAGWGHHLVSRRRYHIIIPSFEEWDKPLPENFICRQTHLLHGLLHCNGFGHLLSIRGCSSGSCLRGHDLMDFWDHLCRSLCTRSISVEDLSVNSLSLPLRLLYSLSHGQPWFARWGYNFSHGCYGITKSTYHDAIDSVSSLRVDSLLADLGDSLLAKDLRQIVTVYRKLSGEALGTIREFVSYLLGLRHKKNYPPLAFVPHSPSPSSRQRRQSVISSRRKRCRDFDEVAESLQSRWPVRRLRYAAEVIADALREHGTLTRQEVRDAARQAIGDTGLIDFVVKSIGDTIVGGQAVRRTPHPRTRVLEFSLDDVDMSTHEHFDPVKPLTWPSKEEVGRDIDTLYQSAVNGRCQEARIILDCKHWAKHWELRDDTDDKLRFVVEWRPMPWEMANLRGTPLPGEVVVLEPHASMGDLLVTAERAMRDTYCIMERFRAQAVEGVYGDLWEPVMSGGAQSGATIGILGDGVDLESTLRYEGGDDMGTVDCWCGAREDDGERMVACDVCATWHHTRCVGMDDDKQTPSMFLCPRCGGSSFDSFDFDDGKWPLTLGWGEE